MTKLANVDLPVLNEDGKKLLENMLVFQKEHSFSKVAVIEFFAQYRSTKGYADNSFKDPLTKKVRKRYNFYCEHLEGLAEALGIYLRYNSSYIDNVVSAFMIEAYTYKCDFTVGDLVHSPSLGITGYAGENIQGVFLLFGDNAMKTMYHIGKFNANDFVKVRITK